jgi:hypothetical protein
MAISEAKRAYNRLYYQANKHRAKKPSRKQRDAYNERRRAQYASDPLLRQKIIAQTKEWREKHPGWKRDCDLRNAYGITLELFHRLLEMQHGGCAICETKHVEGDKHKSLHVDHDHKTGEIRGLLCSNCNHGIGKFKDDPEQLRRAAEYLEGDNE